MRPVHRTEQLIRSVILLVSCGVFSLIAYFAGFYNLPDQRWTYACIVLIVGAAAIVSRLGAKWIARNFIQPKGQ